MIQNMVVNIKSRQDKCQQNLFWKVTDESEIADKGSFIAPKIVL